MATDGGTRTTSNPSQAYDGDLSTYALVSGATTSVNTSSGFCTFSGWPSLTLQAAATLTVSVATYASGPDNDCSGNVQIGNNNVNVFDLQDTTSQTSYTYTIPSGTSLNTVSFAVSSDPGQDDTSTGDGGNTNSVQANQTQQGSGNGRYIPAQIKASVYEIYIQT